MNQSLYSSIHATKKTIASQPPHPPQLLLGASTTLFAASRTNLFASALAPDHTGRPH